MSKYAHLRQKRSDVDWSRHEVNKIEYEKCKIWELKIPGSSVYCVRFINSMGTMMVNGDLGNWVFNREFHPSPDGYVSGSYWCEKIKISSTQKTHDWCPKESRKLIEEFIVNRILEGETFDDNELEYLNDCLDKLDDMEWEFDYQLYNYYPPDWDIECVSGLKGYKISVHLEIIFDAFNEICRRMEAKQK